MTTTLQDSIKKTEVMIFLSCYCNITRINNKVPHSAATRVCVLCAAVLSLVVVVAVISSSSSSLLVYISCHLSRCRQSLLVVVIILNISVDYILNLNSLVDNFSFARKGIQNIYTIRMKVPHWGTLFLSIIHPSFQKWFLLELGMGVILIPIRMIRIRS